MTRLERQIKKEADRIANVICALYGGYSTAYLEIEKALIRRHNKSIEIVTRQFRVHDELGCLMPFVDELKALKIPSRRSPERRKR